MQSPSTFTDITRIGLIAGEGSLPLHVARNAAAQGLDVVPFTLSRDNCGALKELCGGRVHKIVAGLLGQTFKLLQQEEISHIVFAGKVNKWILLRDPRLDDVAIGLMKQAVRLNDDAVMLHLIDALEQHGLKVLPQTDYLRNFLLGPGPLTDKPLSDQDRRDIAYGFQMAKEMGRLDIGQSIVVKDGMVLAVEAIEGTDECLKRAGKWARKKGGVVVKVAKPEQDQRFDVPTVGLRTLKTMHRAGLHLLATEAGQTLFLEPEEMAAYANRHNIGMISCNPGDFLP